MPFGIIVFGILIFIWHCTSHIHLFLIPFFFPAGISRDHWHKRRATGGKGVQPRKKRKFELGRPAANTKVSTGPWASIENGIAIWSLYELFNHIRGLLHWFSKRGVFLKIKPVPVKLLTPSCRENACPPTWVWGNFSVPHSHPTFHIFSLNPVINAVVCVNLLWFSFVGNIWSIRLSEHVA